MCSTPHKNTVACKSWDEAINYLAKPQVQDEIQSVWVVGGSHIYKV